MTATLRRRRQNQTLAAENGDQSFERRCWRRRRTCGRATHCLLLIRPADALFKRIAYLDFADQQFVLPDESVTLLAELLAVVQWPLLAAILRTSAHTSAAP